MVYILSEMILITDKKALREILPFHVPSAKMKCPAYLLSILARFGILESFLLDITTITVASQIDNSINFRAQPTVRYIVSNLYHVKYLGIKFNL